MIFKENEIYKLDGAQQNLPGFDDKYHNIVDYILKITDEIWEQRAIWVIHETYETDVLIHSGAEKIHGVDSVISGTIKTLSAFPDRIMGGETVIWSKDKNGEFFSSHRIGSTATNTGESAFGAPTGKKVFFRTIADCAIRENKIYEEWLVRDNLHLIKQLGFDPVEMAKRDTRYKNVKTKYNNTIASNGKVHSFDLTKPEDLVHSLFENVWKTQDFAKLDEYYYVLSKVHSICEKDLVGPAQLRNHLEEIFASFPDAKFEVQRITCNELEEETEVAVRWKMVGTHSGDGFFSPASGKEIVMPGICHYIIKDGKIHEEWMIFDGFDVLCQIHADAKIETSFSQNGKEDIDLKNKKKHSVLLKKLLEQEILKKI
ncbi:ester cyclase [bacterium]|nr:ester cyclase [bacterium]